MAEELPPQGPQTQPPHPQGPQTQPLPPQGPQQQPGQRR